MKILFLSDRNLTHDIRVFNELMFASNLGHKTGLIAFDDPWSRDIEKVHLDLAKPRYYSYLSTSGALLSKVLTSGAKLLYPMFKKNLALTALSLDAKTSLIWRKLSSMPRSYDLIVAHGFSSLYPAYAYARKTGAYFAFDAASFIPELRNIDFDTIRFHKNKFLFSSIVPYAAYYTYSTDLVGLKLNNVFTSLQKRRTENFAVANSYPEDFLTFRPSISDKVEFVWIGQKIDLCPDLELIIPTLQRFRDKIRLNIFGEITERFRNKYIEMSDFIVLHKPMPVDLLLKTVASYDVGLAIYLTYISPEKNYTLSNKIYAYVQNGLYTLASDTVSQRIFFSENPELGRILLPNIENLTQAIYDVIENINFIREKKQQRFLLAKKFSWKYESQKLFNMWNQKLQKGR